MDNRIHFRQFFHRQQIKEKLLLKSSSQLYPQQLGLGLHMASGISESTYLYMKDNVDITKDACDILTLTCLSP